MKRCTKCRSLKELSQFNKRRASKDGHQCYCRKCENEIKTKYNHEVRGYLPMSENKACTSYLGVAVAERLVNHLFKDVVRMPYGNPGYDFICARDKKIDVKSACITLKNNNNKNPYWSIHINKNKIADYFLLLAFNNRNELEPQYQWLIPSNVLNHLTCASITPSTINKWDEYRQPISPAQVCCNALMGGM